MGNKNPFVEIRIWFLVHGKHNIATLGITSCFISAFVGSFHDSGAATRHYGKTNYKLTLVSSKNINEVFSNDPVLFRKIQSRFRKKTR